METAMSVEMGQYDVELSAKVPPPNRPHSSVIYEKPKGLSVDVRLELDLWRGAEEVWREVSDLKRFLTVDPFHEQVTLMRPEPAAGVHLVLRHNVFGFRFLRFGKILQWDEGRRYAFSDLSSRGKQHGFPHLFFVDVEPVGPQQTRLTVRVRGKWTTWLVPMCLVRLWLTWVVREHARLLVKVL